MSQRKARQRKDPRRDAAVGRPPTETEIGAILARARDDSAGANEELFVALYETLRSFARGAMSKQSASHTLQPTALVNEVYLKLVRHRGGWQGRAQFLATAARAMRCVLVDHARTRGRRRRTPNGRRVSIDDVMVAYEKRAIDVLALDETLRRLGAQDARAADVVELRFFAGLSLPDVAAVLDVPLRTVERDWQWARVWLRANLE